MVDKKVSCDMGVSVIAMLLSLPSRKIATDPY
jgi:hypothetical protein